MGAFVLAEVDLLRRVADAVEQRLDELLSAPDQGEDRPVVIPVGVNVEQPRGRREGGAEPARTSSRRALPRCWERTRAGAASRLEGLGAESPDVVWRFGRRGSGAVRIGSPGRARAARALGPESSRLRAPLVRRAAHTSRLPASTEGRRDARMHAGARVRRTPPGWRFAWAPSGSRELSAAGPASASSSRGEQASGRPGALGAAIGVERHAQLRVRNPTRSRTRGSPKRRRARQDTSGLPTRRREARAARPVGRPELMARRSGSGGAAGSKLEVGDATRAGCREPRRPSRSLSSSRRPSPEPDQRSVAPNRGTKTAGMPRSLGERSSTSSRGDVAIGHRETPVRHLARPRSRCEVRRRMRCSRGTARQARCSTRW